MSGPFGASQWGYNAGGVAFENWGGTMASQTRGTYANSTGVYNLSTPSTQTYSTTGGGMYVIGMHQKVNRGVGIANSTTIQGQNGSLSGQGALFKWNAQGALHYRFSGTSFTTTSETYSTAIPYVILDMTNESGNANQIRIYGGDDTLIGTFNYGSNTTWTAYTCSFDSQTCAYDLEPIGQSNYSFS